MSRKEEELDAALKLLQALKAMDTSQPLIPNQGKQEGIGDKLGSVLGMVPAIIALVGAIYYTGVQANEWSESKEKTKLELRAEFAEKFVNLKESVRDDYRELQSKMENVLSKNRELEKELEDTEERLDEVLKDNEMRDRTVSSMYRTQQYLKTQHNVSVFPQGD